MLTKKSARKGQMIHHQLLRLHDPPLRSSSPNIPDSVIVEHLGSLDLALLFLEIVIQNTIHIILPLNMDFGEKKQGIIIHRDVIKSVCYIFQVKANCCLEVLHDLEAC
jgi:hypothetical protein